MSDVLLLDSGPLGFITQPQRSHEVIAITDWLKDCLIAGARVLVPAIVYYEIKRELLRANKAVGIAGLDAFVNAATDRYVPLTDDALRFAAELWAQSRRVGGPRGARHRCIAGRAGPSSGTFARRRNYEPKTFVPICACTTLDRYRTFDVCPTLGRQRHTGAWIPSFLLPVQGAWHRKIPSSCGFRRSNTREPAERRQRCRSVFRPDL